jgi:PilZ domain
LTGVAQSERRKNIRMGMAMPVRVSGYAEDGATWEEVSKTDDVSQGGLAFQLSRRVELGQVLGLNLPLPKRLRDFDLNEPSYRVYSLVRGITYGEERCRIGVMFFGKYPPKGFRDKPGARYLLPSDSVAGMPVPPGLRLPPPPGPATLPLSPRFGSPIPAEPMADGELSLDDRRASPRVNLFVNLTLQLVDEWGVVLQEELTVADNLSRGGAHLMTSLEFAKSDVVMIQEASGDFASRAEVRGVTRGRDGIIRLHLKFLDRQAPDRMLGIVS